MRRQQQRQQLVVWLMRTTITHCASDCCRRAFNIVDIGRPLRIHQYINPAFSGLLYTRDVRT